MGGNVPDLDWTLRQYWKWRLETHFNDRYRGKQLTKFPEDLRTYQKVIEETQPNVIIELGTYDGGSAMWFHDQMRGITHRASFVATVDVADVRLDYQGVIVIHGDLRDDDVLHRVEDVLDAGDRVMVVEDSAHTYDVTSAALRLYSEFVTPGCYFVVEDGIVDDPELSVWAGSVGVQPAIVDFLATDAGKGFTREWRDEFGLTMHPGGWLRKNET